MQNHQQQREMWTNVYLFLILIPRKNVTYGQHMGYILLIEIMNMLAKYLKTTTHYPIFPSYIANFVQ